MMGISQEETVVIQRVKLRMDGLVIMIFYLLFVFKIVKMEF